MLLELQQFRRKRDIRLQEILSILTIRTWLARVFLNVQPNSSAGAASAGETDDDAGAVGEFDVEALVG